MLSEDDNEHCIQGLSIGIQNKNASKKKFSNIKLEGEKSKVEMFYVTENKYMK